jgi:hypothetical protein
LNQSAGIVEIGAPGVKDTRRVIGILRGKFVEQMDMAKAGGMVKTKLQSKVPRPATTAPIDNTEACLGRKR